SRQVISGTSSALVHPAEFYVALDPGADLFVKVGQAVRPSILAVDPAGKHVGRVAVKVALVQRTWNVARQQTGAGALHTVAAPVDREVATCAVTTAEAPASCSLAPPSGGYFLLRATATDKRGNPVGAAAPLYALGEGAAAWGDGDRMKLELVPDKS